VPELAKWDSFYVIVGSAAGALIGLQFVVMTLIASRPVLRTADAGAAFSSPTIIYFGTTLFLSALLRVPWESTLAIAVITGVTGAVGFLYDLFVARRIRKQDVYRPVFEDWLCHVVLPLAGYATLGGSAVAILWHPAEALFGIAFSALLFLFIGIHNSWDAVSYHVFSAGTQQSTNQSSSTKRSELD